MRTVGAPLATLSSGCDGLKCSASPPMDLSDVSDGNFDDQSCRVAALMDWPLPPPWRPLSLSPCACHHRVRVILWGAVIPSLLPAASTIASRGPAGLGVLGVETVDTCGAGGPTSQKCAYGRRSPSATLSSGCDGLKCSASHATCAAQSAPSSPNKCRLRAGRIGGVGGGEGLNEVVGVASHATCAAQSAPSSPNKCRLRAGRIGGVGGGEGLNEVVGITQAISTTSRVCVRSALP